ncbi:SRPBCC family protein [Phenylobacterium sp. LjRoot219]|uniref:SRPBCC family protein n=1 Tax=Phenylobacterium sp. LjRoot219 TaxID=3342283 RepID=UPI003ECC661C
MATIHREIHIACDPDRAWSELRDFGAAARLFAGVLTDCQEAAGLRTVTFASDLVVQERLVGRDEARRRLAYTVVDGGFTQHSAAMQLLPEAGGVRFVWTSDFLPDDAASTVEPLVEAGCQAIKRVLEAR